MSQELRLRMASTARFVFVCAVWVLAFPFLVGLAFGEGGYAQLFSVGAVAVLSLLAGPLWIAAWTVGLDGNSLLATLRCSCSSRSVWQPSAASRY